MNKIGVDHNLVWSAHISLLLLSLLLHATRMWSCNISSNSVTFYVNYFITFLANRQNCEKLLLSLLMSVRPHGATDGFRRNLIYEHFWKSVIKILIFMKIGKNNGYFTWKPMYTHVNTWVSSSSSEQFSEKGCRETKTHVYYYNLFPKIVPYMR
jgi:hypothetical protein